MIYRRNESFRYNFGKPLSCLVKELPIPDEDTNHPHVLGRIIEISPNGLRLLVPSSTSSNKVNENIQIEFTINDVTLSLKGVLIWEKAKSEGCYYGVQLKNSLSETNQLIEEIKKHVKNERMN